MHDTDQLPYQHISTVSFTISSLQWQEHSATVKSFCFLF
jgi:hypothetical protein